MSTTPFSVTKFRYLFIGCWLLWIALQAKLLHWYAFPLKAALADSLISNVLLAAVCILLSNMFRFYLPTKDRYGYLLALCVFFTAIWFFLSRFILVLTISSAHDYESFFALSVPVRLAIAFLIIGSMVLLSVLWYTQQDYQENEKRKSDAERMAKEAELYNLRQQLQPHFLFNSLNSINALIGFKPTEARHMIQQLSDFLRGTLKKDNNQFTTLAEELRHLKLYLDIEMVRFGHRLQTSIECPENCEHLKMPAMLLQPIVENAIKYGLYDTTDNILITVAATFENGNLIITVQNPFDPATSSVTRGTGFGLSSVQRRLYLVFAQHGLLQTNADKNIFTTTITIPQPND